MPLLKIVEGAEQGKEIRLGERATLGRSQDCDVQINNAESSRNHAEVFLRDGKYYVKDLDSSNGTFVNGARTDQQVLQHGDRIEIGSVTVQYVDEKAATSDTRDLKQAEPTVQKLRQEEQIPVVPGHKVIKRLAKSHLSETYQATELAMDRPVAVEIISEKYCADPERVLKRIKSAARVEHQALAYIYLAGRKGDLVFFSRQPDTGESMWEQRGKLAPNEIVEVGIAIAGALAQAHEASIIHGSVRPDRIVRAESGHFKVLGLGLPIPKVDALSDEPDLQNQPSRIAYMAPEQMAGGAPTAASDIYSLGAVLYYMVCGRAPFEAPSEAELRSKIASEKIPKVLSVSPKASGALARIIDTMLSRDPSERQRSMQEVKRRLEAIKQIVRAPATETSPAARRVTRPPSRARAHKRSSAKAIIVIIFGALLLTAVLLLSRVAGGWFIRQGAGPS